MQWQEASLIRTSRRFSQMSNPLLIRDQVRNPQIYVESTLTALVESSFFSTFIGAMILTNSIFIGIQTEYEATTWQATVPPFFVVSTLVAIPKKLLRTQNLTRSFGTRVIRHVFFPKFLLNCRATPTKVTVLENWWMSPKEGPFQHEPFGPTVRFFLGSSHPKDWILYIDDHVILVTRKTGRG